MPLLVQYLSHIEKGLLQRLQARLLAVLRAVLRVSDATPGAQAHCDRLSADQNGRVTFRIRHVGGLSESRGKKNQQTQRLWIDMEFPDPAVGHVRADLYELQPPLLAGEAKPPRPHSPPGFGTDSDEDDQVRLLS